MLPICPHLIPDYFEKVRDIIRVYRSQIVEQVEYKAIFWGLVSRKVYSLEQHEEIINELKLNTDQMAQALEIIQRRLWGFEDFVMVLMDQNINPWLTEELFQAYSRYLVEHIKRQKIIRECDCPIEAHHYLGVLNDRWKGLVKKMEIWVSRFRSSLGFGESKGSFSNKTGGGVSISSTDLDGTLPVVNAGTGGRKTESMSSEPEIPHSLNQAIKLSNNRATNLPYDTKFVDVGLSNTTTAGSGLIALPSEKKDLQFGEDQESFDVTSWLDIEEEIAALDISRISALSLDLDWDLENDEEFQIQDSVDHKNPETSNPTPLCTPTDQDKLEKVTPLTSPDA